MTGLAKIYLTLGLEFGARLALVLAINFTIVLGRVFTCLFDSAFIQLKNYN